MRVRICLVGLLVVVSACGGGEAEEGVSTTETTTTTVAPVTLPPLEVFSAAFSSGLAPVSERNGYPLDAEKEAALIDLWLESAQEEGPRVCQSFDVGTTPFEYAAAKLSNGASDTTAGTIRSAAVAVEALLTAVVADDSLCPAHQAKVSQQLPDIQAMVARVMAEPGMATLPTEVVMEPVNLAAMTVFLDAVKTALLSGGYRESDATKAVTDAAGEDLLVRGVRLCNHLEAGEDLTTWVVDQVESVELRLRKTKTVEVQAVFDSAVLEGSLCPVQADNAALVREALIALLKPYKS